MINLKDLRVKSGVTQEQLANECGVQRTTISMIETGENRPSVELAKKFAEVFNIKWSDFFEDTE